jgi:hypothetical protein
MPICADDRITYIGRVDHRSGGPVFGIRQSDRRSHFYVVGKTGTGKSHLLRTMLEQDIAAGQGCALFDPHGDLVHEVLASTQQSPAKDVVFLDVPDPNLRWHFNPFTHVAPDKQALAAAGIVEVFKKIWPDDWGPRLEHLLRNVVFTLLETSGGLADVPSLLTDKTFRAQRVANLKNQVVRAFWIDEFDRYSQPFRAVVTAPLQNKIGALLTDPLLRRILTEAGPSLDLSGIMDGGKILLVNLDKGRIGEGPATLLGSFLLSHMALVGIGRSAVPAEERRDFFVYLDEFQTFTTESLANMLSELRKYRVALVLAHQYLTQLDPTIRDAVFGNIGSFLSFRVGGADAAFLAREFAPQFDTTDLTSLPRFSAYVRLMIDGATSAPFSATTLESSPIGP